MARLHPYFEIIFKARQLLFQNHVQSNFLQMDRKHVSALIWSLYQSSGTITEDSFHAMMIRVPNVAAAVRLFQNKIQNSNFNN